MTPNNFMQRVCIDAVTGCWIWRGWFADGVPMMNLSRGKSASVRRIAWEQAKGTIPKGRFPSVTCDDRRCINPEHAMLCTRGGYMRLARKRGTIIHDAAWRAKITVAKRAGSPVARHLDEIRRRLAEGESQSSVARVFGVSQTTIYNIDNGRHFAAAPSALALLATQAGML